jgi:dTDP-glucose pyrophosphorylase/CBS domain-containing protein
VIRRQPELFCLRREATIRDAAACIDRNRTGVAVLVDDEGRLLATVTDGDLRRALLGGATLETPVASVKPVLPAGATAPVTAPRDISLVALLALMRGRSVRQVPLVDSEGRPVDLVTLEDLVVSEGGPTLDVQAVVMAGGFGARMRPLTDELPKPMLPIGDKPIMEHIVAQLRESGVRNVNVTTHYHPEKIQEHFGDGSAFGVDVRYVSEDKPLGTAGALSLLSSRTQPMLVVNGDILTRMNFGALHHFHCLHGAELTVAVRQYDISVPYGVVECDGAAVVKLREKPNYPVLVNAGIYLVEPSVFDLIPVGERFDMTDLIDALIVTGRRVASFPVVEYWIDIGQHDDYRRAQEDFGKGWKQ